MRLDSCMASRLQLPAPADSCLRFSHGGCQLYETKFLCLRHRKARLGAYLRPFSILSS